MIGERERHTYVYMWPLSFESNVGSGTNKILRIRNLISNINKVYGICGAKITCALTLDVFAPTNNVFQYFMANSISNSIGSCCCCLLVVTGPDLQSSLLAFAFPLVG